MLSPLLTVPVEDGTADTLSRGGGTLLFKLRLSDDDDDCAEFGTSAGTSESIGANVTVEYHIEDDTGLYDNWQPLYGYYDDFLGYWIVTDDEQDDAIEITDTVEGVQEVRISIGPSNIAAANISAFRVSQDSDGSQNLAALEESWVLYEASAYLAPIPNAPIYIALGFGLPLTLYWLVLDRYYYVRASKRNRYILMGVKFLERDVDLKFRYFDKVFSSGALVWELIQLSSFSFLPNIPWAETGLTIWLPILSLQWLIPDVFLPFFYAVFALYAVLGIVYFMISVLKIDPSTNSLLSMCYGDNTGTFGSLWSNIFSGQFFLEMMLIPSLSTFFGMIACDYGERVTVSKAPNLECFEGQHWILVVCASLAIIGILPASLNYAVKKDTSRHYLTYLPRFRVELVIMKVLLTAVSTLVAAVPLVVVLLACGINLSLMVSTLRHQPCLSPGNMWANNFRSASFAASFYSGLCALFTILIASPPTGFEFFADVAIETPLYLFLGGIIPVMLIVFFLDRSYGRKNLPLDVSLKVSDLLVRSERERSAGLKLLENIAVMNDDGAQLIVEAGLVPILLKLTEDSDVIEESQDKAESIVLQVVLSKPDVAISLARINGLETVVGWINEELFDPDLESDTAPVNAEYVAALEILSRQPDTQIALGKQGFAGKLMKLKSRADGPVLDIVDQILGNMTNVPEGVADVESAGGDVNSLRNASSGPSAGLIKAIVREKRKTMNAAAGSLADLQSALAELDIGGQGGSAPPPPPAPSTNHVATPDVPSDSPQHRRHLV